MQFLVSIGNGTKYLSMHMQCIQVPDTCIYHQECFTMHIQCTKSIEPCHVGQVKSKMLNVLEHESRKLLMWVLQVAESSKNYGKYRVTYC